ncbi:MAG: AAA family ATPase [Chloroflexi bacterium]|nr:AAA family ATPase [Chloroflexota bacterium]
MMKRILVLGSSGSGKSTVTRKLGELLEIEAIHLDSYFWQPDWTATPPKEWDKVLRNLLQRDCWVMDGNYPDSLDLRLEHADAIVFLDSNRLLCLWRCLGRYLKHRGQNRPELALGCHEKIDGDFLQWIWNYPKNVKPKVLAVLVAH